MQNPYRKFASNIVGAVQTVAGERHRLIINSQRDTSTLLSSSTDAGVQEMGKKIAKYDPDLYRDKVIPSLHRIVDGKG